MFTCKSYITNFILIKFLYLVSLIFNVGCYVGRRGCVNKLYVESVLQQTPLLTFTCILGFSSCNSYNLCLLNRVCNRLSGLFGYLQKPIRSNHYSICLIRNNRFVHLHSEVLKYSSSASTIRPLHMYSNTTLMRLRYL